jgi:hypothetical protein
VFSGYSFFFSKRAGRHVSASSTYIYAVIIPGKKKIQNKMEQLTAVFPNLTTHRDRTKAAPECAHENAKEKRKERRSRKKERRVISIFQM